ncbi:beta-lactamase-like protein [Microdochium trichocladiopsis]|uniref:Beta-lactamase-like protein n=1 Tax=Microdochium trichocladiopsis TaxID=1682393 RepID=A0A9P9BTS7_9PEZI|nr:beta-lactamase-like protein [Microdochium trichocladiopsis]KAH7037302.1 beta-lactamase-like protein [Microdochium trichocladiopsis]
MSSKLIPSDPDEVMVIRNITPNIVTLSVPFSRFGVVHVGGRATIIRMTTGNLAVFSPVALTHSVKAKLAELGGTVDYLVAGDIEHHIFLSEWKREFPAAKVIGPEGLPEKRAKVHNDDKITPIDFHHVLTDENHDGRGLDQDFLADFDVEYVGAHANKEVVLHHKPDRVLIQADLFFNLPAVEQYSRVPAAQRQDGGVVHGLLNRFFQSFQSTQGEAKGNKRFQWYVLSAGNRQKYNESVRRIHAWDFDTVIPCHGETMEKNGKEIFNKVFQWHIQGSK